MIKTFLLYLSWMGAVFGYEVKTLCLAPRIYFIENFLTSAECDTVIKEATPHLKRSTVLDKNPDGAIDPRRTSYGMFFPSNPSNSVLKRIEKKVAELTRIPIENGEAIQVLRYGIGGEYQPHYDYFSASQPGGAESLKRGGQRVATVIMYLNTPEKGGETIFPHANISVTPKKGSAVLFYNVTPDGKDDPKSFHGGAPVLAGEKWIATKWLRQGVFK